MLTMGAPSFLPIRQPASKLSSACSRAALFVLDRSSTTGWNMTNCETCSLFFCSFWLTRSILASVQKSLRSLRADAISSTPSKPIAPRRSRAGSGSAPALKG